MLSLCLIYMTASCVTRILIRGIELRVGIHLQLSGAWTMTKHFNLVLWKELVSLKVTGPFDVQ